MSDPTLCARCRRPLVEGERCPEHGLFAVAESHLVELDEAPLLGQVLNGQVALTGLIGQGGMGTVYRGVDLSLQRPVAVKVLHANFTATRKDRERFEREARALSRLQSPSTVTLFQFGVVQDGPLTNLAYMVMELVEGQSLAARLTAGPLPLDTVADLAVQLADSLGEAHQQGIVHRDLKPENILLSRTHDGRLRVKTIDFGIARFEGAARTSSGVLSGTPAYMAPEQCSGDGSISMDGRVDVYATGVVLFQALTGARPFEGTDPLQVLVKQVNLPPPHLNGYERGGQVGALDAVLQRALEKNRDDRFASMADLAAAFGRACAVTAGDATPRAFVAAPVPPASSPTGDLRVARRRRGVFALAAFVGAGLGLGAYFLMTDDEPRPGHGEQSTTSTAFAAVSPATLSPPAEQSAQPLAPPATLSPPAEQSAQPLAPPSVAALAPASTVTPEPERDAVPLVVPEPSPTPARDRRAGRTPTPRARPTASPPTATPTAAPTDAPPAVVVTPRTAPPPPGPDHEATKLAEHATRALLQCRCVDARKFIAHLHQLPSGPDLSRRHLFEARLAKCVPPDVDETCKAGIVHPK